MKITSTPNASLLTRTYGTNSGQAPSAKSPAQGSVSVSISRESQLALKDSSADIDMEKVAAIKLALQNGTLKINPERIADGLIESAKELLE